MMVLLGRSLRSAFLREGSGGVGVYVALALPVLIGAVATTVDMGAAYIMRTRLQNTADSAALAGASALPDTEVALTRALAAVEANMPTAGNGSVLVDGRDVDDFETGNWDSATRTFTPGETPLNAVRVVTRRSTVNGNPLPAFLSAFFGISSRDVLAAAVAVNGGGGIDECLLNGFLADGQFEVGSNVTIQGDTCVHGQGGIKVGSDVLINNGAEVTYGEGTNFEGESNSGNFIADPTQEDKTILSDGQVNDILSAIRNNTSEAPQPNWDQPWTVDSLPNSDFSDCTPDPFKLYIRKKVDLSSCSGTLRDFAVYGDEIKLPSGSSENPFRIQNTYFASNTYIDAGSNIEIGSNNYCNDGLNSVFFIARNWIKFGSDISMWGVQIIAGASDSGQFGLEMGDDYQTTAVAAWSDGKLKLGSSPNANGESNHQSCTQQDHVLTQSANLVLRLVD